MKYYLRITEYNILVLKDSREEQCNNGLHGFYVVKVLKDVWPGYKFEVGWILYDLKNSEYIHPFDTLEEAIGYAALEVL